MEIIEPSKSGNWINQVENEWNDLLPIADKKTKSVKGKGQDRAIFKLFSLGASTNRDDWAYSFDQAEVLEKAKLFASVFNRENSRWQKAGKPKDTASFVDRTIKWTADLERQMMANEQTDSKIERVYKALYRPFITKFLFYSPHMVHRRYATEAMYPSSTSRNPTILASNNRRAELGFGASNVVPSGDYFTPDVATALPLYRYSPSGERIDNITDWALRKFQAKYGKAVTKDDIFHYCYAVLHDPVYRETYAINLKREFPRIPFYPNFEQWVAWGKRLMELHINYEEVEPWPLERVDEPKKRAEGSAPKAVLRSDHTTGNIRLDADTQLTGVPEEAWRYSLGNRTAIDWVLDQHKEKKPRDPTIREKFDTYRFADYKEKVIDLLGRVTRVSVETVAITDFMNKLNRDEWDTTGER